MLQLKLSTGALQKQNQTPNNQEWQEKLPFNWDKTLSRIKLLLLLMTTG